MPRPHRSTNRKRGATAPPRSGVIDLTPTHPRIDWDLAVRRYRDEGWTIAEIARDAHYSLPQVRRGLLDRRVKLRRRVPRKNDVRLLSSLWRGVLARAESLALPSRRATLYAPWRQFAEFRTFAASAGYRPGLALVRVDPKRGFEPGNVRFVARNEVAQYTRWAHPGKPRTLVRAFGETKGLMEWAADRRCLVSASVLSVRLKGGMKPQDAIATPPSQGRRGLIPDPVAARAPSRPRLDAEKAARLYASGMNLAEIGRSLGASRTGVRDGLRRLGVARRPTSTLTITRDGMLLGKVWTAIRSRCSNPRDPNYTRYGGKGVRVCREWSRFEPFYKWARSAGWKPGLCLIRIEARRGYTPGNCRFVTQREASLHAAAPSRTRAPYVLVTAFGETMGLTAWSRDRRCKVTACTFAKRLRDGMRPENALSKEPQTPGKSGHGTRLITAFGETKSFSQWTRDPRCKVREFGLRYRLDQGMDPEAALTTPPWRTSERRGARKG